MKLGTLLAAVVIAPALVALGGPAQAAATYTVTGTTDPSPTPACDGTVCPSLRAAVEAANSDTGSTIQLGSGTYELSQDELSLTASATVVGAGMGLTTIKQTGNYRVLEVGAGTTIAISDLTLTGGHGEVDDHVARAGAILTSGVTTLTRVAITGNEAVGSPATDPGPASASGGAILTVGNSSSLTIVSSTVSDNLTQAGVALAGLAAGGWGGRASGTVNAAGPLTVIDSTFANNIVQSAVGGAAQSPGGHGGDGGYALGGAIYGASSVVVRGGTFANNQARGEDGGDSPDGTGGSAGDAIGAAIAALGPTLVAVNSTFVNNVAASGKGGSGATPGPEGIALGGAIGAEDSNQKIAVTLVSDTFSGNQALSPEQYFGGNLLVDSETPVVLQDSIFEGTDPAGFGSNCRFSGRVTVDSGHNLENTSPSQCGLSAANHDLIGQSAELGSLANNGGPTQTMLPSASSPVIGAGGACTDPTADPVGPLTVDQRGEPRPEGRPCDIGAVQLPVPLNTTPPTVSGPIAGHDATCNHGTFLGADPLTYDYAWTRDGQPVGANQATYPVAIADIGHTLRCTVVAHGAGYDSPPATSAPRTVVPTTPALSSLEQSHSTWRTPSGHSTSVPIGTTFRFTLSEKGTVSITFTRVTYRRLVNGHCVALTSANRSRPRCSAAYARAGTLVRSGRAGRNSLDYRGLLSTGGYLHSGLYVATFTAENTWGRVSRPVKLRFTVAR